MTYIVLGSQEEGLYWEVGCYSEGCYSEVFLYQLNWFDFRLTFTCS